MPAGWSWPGIQVDEWGIWGGSTGCSQGEFNSTQNAAAGWRAARKQWPDLFLSVWGGDPRDKTLSGLVKDGTIDLLMLEVYSYCPHACCHDSCGPVEGEYKKLHAARAEGILHKTILTFGKMYVQGSPMAVGPVYTGCNKTAEPNGCSTEGIIGKICPWSFCKGRPAQYRHFKFYCTRL